METTPAFDGLECTACGAAPAPTAGRCPECDGALTPTYDLDAVDEFPGGGAPIDRGLSIAGGRSVDAARSMWRYDALLPFPRSGAVTLGEGSTPLVACPALADELGVCRVLLKDEGANPTGTTADREASAALTATRDQHTDVALVSPGDDGQAVSAYAARADHEAHVFVPSRTGFVRKAMVNVHGADMRVVGGRLGDATVAFEAARADRDWLDCSPFASPYRHDAAKTVLFEVLDALDWTVPDAVVVPVGAGTTLYGAYRGARQLRALGLIDELPSLYAAQPAGCSPVVRAFENGDERTGPVASPDTIAGELEVPDPPEGRLLLDALRESDGGAVAVEDDDALAAGAAVASREGVETSVAGAVAASGAWTLAGRGAFDPDDTVVVVNPGAGNKDADVLRSYLMGQGL